MDEPEFLFDGGFDQGGHTAFASRHEFIFSKSLNLISLNSACSVVKQIARLPYPPRGLSEIQLCG